MRAPCGCRPAASRALARRAVFVATLATAAIVAPAGRTSAHATDDSGVCVRAFVAKVLHPHTCLRDFTVAFGITRGRVEGYTTLPGALMQPTAAQVEALDAVATIV